MTRTQESKPAAVYTPQPDPGTSAALKAGCDCPVLDNAHGRGYLGQPGVFVYARGCPVHA